MRAACIAAALLLAGAARAAEPAWPELPLPDGARAEMVAADSVMNGRHSRILRARLSGSVDEALDFYRDRFGREHVENPLKDARVIARRDGAFFNTVQLRERGAGQVEATLISTLVEGPAELSRALQDTKRLLPADSALMNSMESRDGERRSIMLTAVNSADLQTNRDELVRGLRQRGLNVSREERATVGKGRSLTLWAENAQEEATLSVIEGGGHSLLVVNRVREIKP
ncbi:MAG: hypothetical protein EOP35_00520 [Rubrivivax sp.]|nr:MAG: hypothetical protein EOP35_00520 [Rubrivivax sp.]